MKVGCNEPRVYVKVSAINEVSALVESGNAVKIDEALDILWRMVDSDYREEIKLIKGETWRRMENARLSGDMQGYHKLSLLYKNIAKTVPF